MSKEVENKVEEKKEAKDSMVESLQVAVASMKDKQVFIFNLPYGFKFDAAKEALKDISDLIEKRSKEYEEHLKKQQDEAKKAQKNKEDSK